MPIYTYKCTNKHITEELVSSDKIEVIECPICKKKAKRIFDVNNIGLKFKGKGFYVTDYKKQTHKEIK